MRAQGGKEVTKILESHSALYQYFPRWSEPTATTSTRRGSFEHEEAVKMRVDPWHREVVRPLVLRDVLITIAAATARLIA